MSERRTALITGASSGFGVEFAKLFARDGFDLVLVARSEPPMRELAERLRSALERLPFQQRTAIVLREVDGLSYEEIAYSLGLPIGTVKSRLTRARLALRADLRDARTI